MIGEYANDYINSQGKQYIRNQQIYSDIFSFPGLELPSQENVGDIIENMETITAHKNKELELYEKEFQKTLSIYNKTYQELNENRLKRIQTLEKSQPYFGKVIGENDGSYHYINNYGFSHKYSTDAWENNNSTCPNVITATDINADLFHKGPDMNVSQPCNLAGKNILNTDTNEIAWVDIKGYKHVYSSDVLWKEKSKTCEIGLTDISGTDYDLIPSGSPMEKTTKCDTMNIDPNIVRKLDKLNDKLIDLARKISREIGTMEIDDEELRKKSEKQRMQMDIYVDNLDKDRYIIHNKNNSLSTIEGERYNSELLLTSNLYQYLIVLAICIIIIVFIVKLFGTETISNSMFIFLCILCVIIVYLTYNA